jgi:hypothetical protein
MSDDSALPLSRTGNPAVVADSFAIRPDMYAGSSVAFERAAAFIKDIGWAPGGRNRTPVTAQQVPRVVASVDQLRGQDRESRARGDPDPFSGAESALHSSSRAHSPKSPLPAGRTGR